jgi:predicted permease
MEQISPTDLMYAKRIGVTFVFAFCLFALIAQIIGEERKARWFKKRERYSFFTRRGALGDFINFGYPRTLEGVAIFVVAIGSIFSFGYWYILP